MVRYLADIEKVILSTPSAEPSRRGDGEKTTFIRKIGSGSSLARPMLRTLVYGGGIRVADDATVVGIEHSNATSKVHFDGRTREARIGIEGRRMRSFVANSLRPAAMALDPESRDEKIPDLLCQIAIAEGRMNADEPNRTVRATGAATSFSGLAKGRRYQGKLGRLIGEVFPDLLDQYHEASQKVSEREILEHIVHS